MDNNLIFDFGFHNGDDSDYYLAKGYRVVAVEANPSLVQEGQRRFQTEIADGRLILLHSALSEKRGKIEFYIHPKNSDWSSCFIDAVRSDGSEPILVQVESVSVHRLFDSYGVPHYLKVDVEGCDTFVAKQVFEYPEKPAFVSYETSRKHYAGIFSYLYVAGYNRFQLVNQANNPDRVTHVPSSTNTYKFTKFSSGLFGPDLPEDNWVSFDEALSRYIKYKELKQIDNKELALGWLDIHARLV